MFRQRDRRVAALLAMTKWVRASSAGTRPHNSAESHLNQQGVGSGDIVLEISTTEDCNAEGAICTADNMMLSSDETLTIAGPP